MWKHGWLMAALLPLAVAAGSGGVGAQALDPEQAARAREVIVEWLECEEGQLEAVVKLSQAAVPTLAATLREGPSPASRRLVESELERRYDELKAYAELHPNAPVASSRDEFVRMYLDNYEALYRVRSAVALGAIGGERAKSALEDSLDRARREDVRRAVRQALEMR
jgi:hypothetical protein